MAEGGVRKSSRIKSRGPMVYAEDDLDLAYDLHLDIANEVFGVLKPSAKQKNSGRLNTRKNSSANVTPSQQKSKGRLDTGRKTTLSTSKKIDKDSSSTSTQQEVKASSENNCVLEDAQAHEDGADFVNSEADCSNVPCSVCDMIFVSEKAMEDHMVETHSDEVKLKEYLICAVCQQICVNQSVYDKHMKLHSNCRKFKCEICEKAFADSCSLKRHMKSHDDDRPYTCDLCMKSFRDNPSLSRHQRTHTDRPRMFNCLKCDKDFTDKHALKRHERTHMDVRPFECETCFKTFSEPGSFRRHLKIHSGVRSFICPVCSRSFLEKQSLIRHQKNVCGFGGDDTSLPSFFNTGQGPDCLDTDVNDSDVSRTAADDKSCVLNENTSPDEYLDTPKLTFTDENTLMLPGNSRKCELSEKLNGLHEPKDAPSLHSLIQKDPELYDSISEIVESIDSYEKMLDLCGDTGQVTIDAALTREPAPMPENLLCFECGEQLVDGENFKAQGKSFHPSLCHSYKCLNCVDVEDYGEPPVLTAEEDVGSSALSVRGNCDDTTDELLQTKQEEKLTPLRDSVSKNIFETAESLEHLRERLKSQHGVFLFGHMYNNYGDSNDDDGEESDMNEQTDHMSSVATSSRSQSTDSEVTHVGNHNGASKADPHDSLAVNTSSFGYSQQDPVSNFLPDSPATPVVQQSCLSITPKLEYEADDQSIPSVFPCHLCTKVFASSAFLTRHLNLHKTSPHKCMVCNKTFTNSQNLKRHITTHTGEKPYTCPYCRKRFRDPSNFSKHRRACCASQSAASPAGSNMSASCVSSPQSLDDSGIVNQVRAHAADLKEKLNFPSCSVTAESSTTQDIPLRFHYDNDEEEDLPVSFGHPPGDSDSAPVAKYIPECSSQHGVNNVGCEDSERLPPQKDVGDTRARPDEETVLIACDVCGKLFENRHLLEIHMKYHSSDPRITCIECGKTFADPFGLKRHLRIHAGIRPHVCEYCGRGYCDNWSLRKHKSRGCMLQEVKVPPDFLHPCPQCARVFSESDFLDEHMKSHSGLLKFECDICQKGFSEAFNLKRHRRLHMAICTSCDREFKDVQSLNDHQANECPVNIPKSAASKEEGFSCQECGRVYSTKAYLERHKKFHSDLKPYACEICSKRFSEAFRLRRHVKVHKGERPFSCETCSKDFTDLSSLKRHLSNSSCSLPRETETSQEIECFSCNLCDKIFTKNYLLARHMNVHSKERPFTCQDCGRTYKDTSSLKRHQLVHQGEKSFICPVCGKDFFYSDSLKRHLTSSCGKKTKARHRRRGRGKGKRKSNNNINMKDKNTVGHNMFIHDLHQQEIATNTIPSMSQSQVMSNKFTYNVKNSSQDARFGIWTCQRNQHCWRCNLKFGTATAFFRHSRVHRHKKPFHCPSCFFRCSRKMYLRIHQRTHKS